MAVLALAFVGEFIGAEIGGTVLGIAASSIGGFIGSTIGSMVDNMLFPSKQTGPRLSDLTVQTSTYGNPIPLLFGPENRIAGNVVWSTGLIETKHTQHQGKGGPSVDVTSYSYSASFAVAVCEGTIKGIKKIWANSKLVYDASVASGPLSDPVDAKSAALWSSMRVHAGDFTQNPDPVIEGVLGVGNVPGYRGTAYVVFESFQLADYGNRLPQLEFLVEKDESITIDRVLVEIAQRCGIDPNTVSTSSVRGDVRGFAIGSASSGSAALQPLALVFNFDSAQVNGQLRFCARGSGPVAVVPSSQLAGHATSDERPQPISWTRQLETSMPREATIIFPDPDRDYQSNSQTARRQAGSADSNLSSQLPIVVDVNLARQLADRMLWEAWVGRATATAQTDDRWIGLEAGRVYGFETPAGIEPLRLKAKTRGANGVIELELARDRSEVYKSTAIGIHGAIPEQTVNVPAPSTLVLIDGPILQDADDDTGFYYMVDGQGEGWRGADVLRSADGGATFDEVSPDGFQAMIGTIDGLGDGPTVIFDNLSVMRVTLDDETDELESVTELDVLNGKNVAWVGGAAGHDGEILQFKTAMLVAPGVYDVSGLLRGRLGTEYAVGHHAAGETFVLLQYGPVRRADFSASDWNKDRVYKAVSLLTSEVDADGIDFINTGEGKRPLSPVHIASTTSAGDMTIIWFRRSRLRQPGLGGGPLPLGESTEAYELDVLVGSAVVRTLAAATPEVVYTAAMQAADGVGSGDTVQVAVYQLSDVRGRGRPCYAELSA